ncbi:MAG: hypothetical protein Q8L78_05725 [Coxiellaceae bacterium]|nr:hypothetical protein [Coxiellaceae bacterium]
MSSIFAFSFSDSLSSSEADQPTQVAQASLSSTNLPEIPAPSETLAAEAAPVKLDAAPLADLPAPISTETLAPSGVSLEFNKLEARATANSPVSSDVTSVLKTQAQSTHKPNNEISLSGGLTFSSLSNGNQSAVIDSDPVFGTTNTYDTQKATQVSGIGGIAYSRLFHFKHDMSVTIGPALYYTNMDEVSGVEHPSTNYASDYDTLNYRYSADSVSLMAESRAIYEKYNWQPFATVGIGPSWNRLYDYSEVPTDPSLSAMPAPEVFRNNTSAQFAYEVGVGIQRLFPANEKYQIAYRLALSYRYFNFGSGELKAASGQATNQALTVNTLDTQAVLLSLGAVF